VGGRLCTCICSMRAPERTSPGQPQQIAERQATAGAGAGANPSTLVMEPLRLVATAAITGPPVRVGVGGEGAQPPFCRPHKRCRGTASSLYACGDV